MVRHLCVAVAGGAIGIMSTLAAVLPATPSERHEATLTVLYTGNLRGVLEPCGCQPLQPGGLSRRATLLRKLRAAHSPCVALDAGDNLTPNRATPELLGIVFDVFKQLHYDRINVGPYDLTLGPATIRQRATQAGIPLVMGTNVGSTEESVPGWHLVQVGGLQIAMIGATVAPGASDSTTAVEAVATAARQVREQADLVILISQLPVNETERCARQIPEIDLIISGRHDADLTPIRRVAHCYILPCSLYGHSVGVATIHCVPRRRITRVALSFQRVDAQLPRDAVVQRAISDFFQ